MSFFQALQQMRHLTSLAFIAKSESNMQAFAESMPSLTGLRFLVLSSAVNIPDTSSEITKRLTILTQLTRLHLSDLPGGQSLRFPTGIVDLHLTRQPVCTEDLAGELVDLTNLTSLNFFGFQAMHLFHPEGVTPFHFFKELGQLKALTLSNVCVDHTFFDAFVTLTGLTELRLGGWYARMDPKLVCRQLSLLSNLQVLKIPFPQFLVDSETGMPQGSLPKLRTINLPRYHAVDANTQASLFEAFPCLRNVNTYRRSSTAL